MSIKSRGDDLKNKVLKLVTFRVVIVTLLMGATAFIHIKEGGGLLAQAVIPVYVLIVTSYLVTILSLIALKFIEKADRFAEMQVATDVMLATALVYVTGGIDSIFSFLYIFIIIGSGIVLQGRGVILIASLSSILYGALLALQYHKILPVFESPQDYSGLQIFYRVFINITAFYAVAFLSRYLFEQLRKTGELLKEKQIDYVKLEAINKKIIQGINSGLMTIDPDGFVTSFNKAAEEITGYTFIEAYNKKIEEIFPGLMDRISRYKAGPVYHRGSGRWETAYTSKDGNMLHLGFSVSSLRYEGGEGNIIIFQDLTQYKEMEEAVRQAEKLTVMGKLAAGMAHEIRNPLASMSGSIQILRDELELDKENRRLMDIILSEMERLNRLITEFLDYARPYKPGKEEVDFSRVVIETLDVFEKGLTQASGITIQRDIMAEVRVHGEQEKLKEVFWNLFNNAVQSMPNGGTLAVSLKNANNMATAIVMDSGEGIEENDVERVFEPFFTTKSYGTGLGLATVYRVVDAHDGRIRVESEKGKGTTFIIMLPLVTAKE